MNIRPIRSEADYAWALSEIEPYFESEPPESSPEADRFDVLATLIDAYEREHHSIEAGVLSTADALREFMALTGRTQSDLSRVLGYRSRASDILLGRRNLTVGMMRKLVREWNMPPELLLGSRTSADEAA